MRVLNTNLRVFPETKRLKISKVDGCTHRNKLGEKKLK